MKNLSSKKQVRVMKSRVLFTNQDADRWVGWVHINEKGYIFGVSPDDSRPKMPVFMADECKENLQSGRIYYVRLKKGNDGKCFIAYDPNPEISVGKVELVDNSEIQVKVGKALLTWNVFEQRNSPRAFMAYLLRRQEIKNKAEVFEQVADCFTKLKVDYTE